MRPNVLPTLLWLFFLPAACASTPPERYPSASIGSGYSLASVEPPRHAATGVGMSRDLEAALVARPDTLLMEVRIEKEDVTAGRALAQAQAAATELAARLQQATSAAATLTLCGTKVTPVGGRGSHGSISSTGSTGKMVGSNDGFNVVVEGRFEVALAPDLDYWKRSGLVAALAELTDRYDTARVAKTADKGVSLGSLRVSVKDPESYRGKLTEQWVQRAHAFAAAAQAREAPLYLLDCAPPGDIVQRERSLEEVALSLAVSCRLGSPKAAGVMPAAR